jgi:hypothetical protein
MRAVFQAIPDRWSGGKVVELTPGASHRRCPRQRSCRGLASVSGKNLAGASQASPARILPGLRKRRRKGSCRGFASIPGKGLDGALPLVRRLLIVGLKASLVALSLLPAVPVRPCRWYGCNRPCTSMGY